MNEKDNIQDLNEELEGFAKLQSLKGKKTFGVPNGYFDNLEDEIMSKIAKETVPAPKIRLSTKQVLYYVAAASIIALFVFIALRSGNQNVNQTPIANQPSNGSNTEIPIAITEKETIETNPSEDREMEVVQKEDSRDESAIAIEENRPPINKVSTENHKSIQRHSSNNAYSEESESSGFDIANNDQSSDNGLSLNSGVGQNVSSITNGGQSTNASQSLSRKSVQMSLFLGEDRCSNKPVRLAAVINDLDSLSYLWSTGDTSSTIAASKTGNYWLKIYDINNSLLGVDTVRVTIIPRPKPNLGQDQNICNYESVLLSSGCNNEDYKYEWSINNATTPEIYLSDLQPGVYNITLWVSSCADTVSSTMTLIVNDCNLKIPNVITPNGDGRNDRFVISGLENYPSSQLFIYDRNGNLVYKALDYKNDWDANQIPAGTYFYQLLLNDGKNSEKNGILTIIR